MANPISLLKRLLVLLLVCAIFGATGPAGDP